MTTEVLVRENAHNPLDLLEEILSANQWPFDRSSDDELVVECNGQWGSYQLHFSWSGDLSAMHFSSYMDMKVPKARQVAVHELLAAVNAKMWLGHFDLTGDERTPVFRHTTLADVAAEFNRYNRQKIVIADSAAGSHVINATLPANDVGAFARMAQNFLGLSVEYRDDAVVISR